MEGTLLEEERYFLDDNEDHNNNFESLLSLLTMVAKRKVPTIKELKAITGIRRRHVGKNVTALQFTSLVHRPVSVYFTKLFLMAGITPDQITMLSYVLAVAAGVFFIFGNYWYSLVGIGLYQLFIILDESDGDTSRYLYGINQNPRGGFLEYIGHSLIQPFVIVCIAFSAYNNPHSLLVGSLFYNNIIILVIGFAGSNLYLALHVLDGVLKSRFSSVTSDDAPTPLVDKQGRFQYLLTFLSRFRAMVNKYILGDLLLLITVVSNTLWLYLLLWTAIHIPLVLINGVTSYRRLPKPQVLKQETKLKTRFELEE